MRRPINSPSFTPTRAQFFALACDYYCWSETFARARSSTRIQTTTLLFLSATRQFPFATNEDPHPNSVTAQPQSAKGRIGAICPFSSALHGYNPVRPNHWLSPELICGIVAPASIGGRGLSRLIVAVL